jgi:hypothetical protein
MLAEGVMCAVPERATYNMRKCLTRREASTEVFQQVSAKPSQTEHYPDSSVDSRVHEKRRRLAETLWCDQIVLQRCAERVSGALRLLGDRPLTVHRSAHCRGRS